MAVAAALWFKREVKLPQRDKALPFASLSSEAVTVWLTPLEIDDGGKRTGVACNGTLWIPVEVETAELTEAAAEEEEQVRERFAGLREPPPIGMSRRVPP